MGEKLVVIPESKFMVEVFNEVIYEYHILNQVDQVFTAPDNSSQLQDLLYKKCWIDTVQWHLEDIIRDPEITPADALLIKRRIDASNQDRTDIVEQIDDMLLEQIPPVKNQEQVPINTESPGWAIDRLSILCLKIYHMKEESVRTSASLEHRASCARKLSLLLEQQQDLMIAIDQLMQDLLDGKRKVKTYRQMKMYNEKELNPVLYKKS